LRMSATFLLAGDGLGMGKAVQDELSRLRGRV
jgi:hypothetical protein